MGRVDDVKFTAKLGDREHFPDLEALVYCNHAAISPPSWPVRRAMQNAIADWGKRGSQAFGTYGAQRSRLREKIARLVGASAEEIAFVPNTSSGVTAIALSFPWKRGDRVILFEGEFPANVTPWLRAGELFGVTPVFLPLSDFQESDERGLGRLAEELAKGARLVAVSAVQFRTGLRMPLGEMARLCHTHGAELFVDGIQATGAVPVDVRALGIDYWASGGHKWLMGPEGTGMLYVRKERVEALEPYVAGWLSHEDAVRFLLEGPGHMRYDRPLKKRADVFEVGCINAIGLVGLEAAVDVVDELGVEKIYAHVVRWGDAVEAGLVERGFTSLRAAEANRRSGILAVLPPKDIDVVALHRALLGRGISTAIPDGVLRFSPHWPNNVDEAEQVLLSMEDALAELRGAPRPRSDDW
ncbi:aminotransferase class V-fold PLP-dependent enzyme [Polyangium jinanense]|uniref:Aminotransferase class V-fold PLP-dependent enzyme n=1 Tax=Polyangium jinanense TaxID=2829994 RepID=A0A9X3WVW1_9BACT|nr:aminotransferase class V-fold PLP-dependent enzyme [Polyangium jinanense]MDC3953610.1 aminotransferase class V-fold PLP-dependent enzyme [Polyangium jinanense]MDC3979269.1 aminotransferase class V-fold PLP-dependent enzyme [Polyangium jinanense]